MNRDWACIDGNEAAARVAHALSEIVAIYPITPASPMGEFADTWSAAGRPNLWGVVPEVVEMQSEAGAAGTLHGALLGGSLATTFTSSQGLLLMLPNMFKIAGELMPAVIHVAARAVATHALSIFGDHSDVMAARTTGWAMLASASVQEAHDLALVAHASTLRARVPFLHFFDGFRTSHEVNRIELLDDGDLRALVDDDAIALHRQRGLSPDHPMVRGTAQNPDVFFQSREAANRYYAAIPDIVEDAMNHLAARTGRRYGLVDYAGAADAEHVIVSMGSGSVTAASVARVMAAAGAPVGAMTLRLFRPFPVDAFLASLPPTVRRIAVMDRTKEPGAVGEPLYLDVVAALAEAGRAIEVVGARYGLASKELTPALVKGVFDELDVPVPRPHVTVGIRDDVTHLSIQPDTSFTLPFAGTSAVFFGLGADGSVGAAKENVKILATTSDRFAQAYFVYDSKKSGALTVSHVRVADTPIDAPYLVDEADIVACHQFALLDRVDVLSSARRGATLLLNAPYAAAEIWEHLPAHVQSTIVDRELDLWVVDAERVASAHGLGRRINTVMQACFFAVAGLLPLAAAIDAVKASIGRSYGKRGDDVVTRNDAAVDAAVGALQHVPVPSTVTAPTPGTRQAVHIPVFVHAVTEPLLAGRGDELPVSALPADGAFPTATARYEKRHIASAIPVWDPSICIDCGKCAIVCPHAAIRMKVYEPDALAGAPDGFASKTFRSRALPDHWLTVQVAPDDCTGCGVCVEVCPAHRKDDPAHKSLMLEPIDVHHDREATRWDFFLTIPELARDHVEHDSVKTSQLLQPLFEFSGACAGCGETPYLKLLSQLFGDRLVVANATGCSSIYGGNLPTTPWATAEDGRGPAWANSLFEDNAEFGLGLELSSEHRRRNAIALLTTLAPRVGEDLAAALLHADQTTEAEVLAQRARVDELLERLAPSTATDPDARRLADVAADLVRHSLWIVGGDGWAYDIGSGGVDHVLGSGRNVNLLVLDSQVYSNTGGQASKATPRGAVAKFAAAGKRTAKKDLALEALSYGDVYVAQIALGGSDVQTVKALLEADAWPGPSLVIAYASCVPAHGFAECDSMARQRDAVHSGMWPLFRYRPTNDAHEHPFSLDSHAPTLPVRDFAAGEERFAVLARRDPQLADELVALAQADVDERWRLYEQLAGLVREAPG